MPKAKILDVREWPSAQPTRLGLLDLVITYQIDPFKTYVTTMPKEDFTEEKLKEKIREDLKSKAELIDKEFEV